ncbi:hypothetical protein KZ483_14790 [Paenibacillus sp. sptzw28]|nr:hypothetical protein [Paenibacillus sp. sptzw28]QYR19220.1 hypothetical protein KZ483_14790 [Paenibacillus sp. sptzw28]
MKKSGELAAIGSVCPFFKQRFSQISSQNKMAGSFLPHYIKICKNASK